MNFESVNPCSGEIVGNYVQTENETVQKLIKSAHEGFLTWKKTGFSERSKKMLNVVEILRKNAGKYGRIMTEEMGKTLKSAVSEAEKSAWVCEYYAENAENFLQPLSILTDAQKSYVRYDPLGVILIIMPWNFPFWQVFRCAAPALMAGNAVVLKHASNVFGCACAIEDIFQEAELGDVFKNLIISGSQVSELTDNPFIKGVSITGSTAAGRSVASAAGKNLKKSVLELGGSDPYIVLADADIEYAVKICVQSRLINAGQTCISAKRFIVVKEVKDTFINAVCDEMKKTVYGNPLDPGTDIGPLARDDIRQELHSIVRKSVTKGAKCLLGGFIPEGSGYFYPPTVLDCVTEDMPAFYEETFGPVAVVITAENEEHAVQLANNSVFGLGAAVFTRNIDQGEKIVEKLNAGCCFVNDFVKSDPRLPFGGINESGYGRELSQYGIQEFVNIKTVYVK